MAPSLIVNRLEWKSKITRYSTPRESHTKIRTQEHKYDVV